MRVKFREERWEILRIPPFGAIYLAFGGGPRVMSWPKSLP